MSWNYRPTACSGVQFVSRFTENKMDGEKLERVFQKIKAGKASAAAVHSTGIGNDGKLRRFLRCISVQYIC